jgi:hypothetical protein
MRFPSSARKTNYLEERNARRCSGTFHLSYSLHLFVAYWLLYPPLLEPLSLWLIPCGSTRISFQRANWVPGQRCAHQAKDWTDHGCRGNGRLPFDLMAGRPTIAFCKVCAPHSKQIQALVERSLAYWSKQPPESSFFPLRLRSISSSDDCRLFRVVGAPCFYCCQVDYSRMTVKVIAPYVQGIKSVLNQHRVKTNVRSYNTLLSPIAKCVLIPANKFPHLLSGL